MTPSLWNQFLDEAIKTIRKSNPNRTLVIGTANWGGLGGLNDLVLPENEKNIIVTFHYYNPFHFTHQGAGWVKFMAWHKMAGSLAGNLDASD